MVMLEILNLMMLIQELQYMVELKIGSYPILNSSLKDILDLGGFNDPVFRN